MTRFDSLILNLLIFILFGPVAASAAPAGRDSLIVSLITVDPGGEIYALDGHTALRIRSESMDSVWNYGVFDFNQPNFVYRFVKGETDYIVAGYPFAWFMPEYVAQGRRVTEQVLNISQPEAHSLLQRLTIESRPENRTYRYNYIKDNCATRPLARIEQSVNRRIIYPDSVRFGSYRNSMRHYHRNYPWYQLGIDLALGSGLDVATSARDEMYVPIDMMRSLNAATYENGEPLVARTNLIYAGHGNPVAPPTSPWLSPLFIFALLSALLIAAAIYMWRRHSPLKWVVSAWYIIIGLAGCIIAFLVFMSSHEATSPNALIFWLNPVQLIAGITIWWRHTRPFTTLMAWYNVIVTGLLCVIWVFQPQSTNPALFAPMGATVILSAAYAINANKVSYKKKRCRS